MEGVQPSQVREASAPLHMGWPGGSAGGSQLLVRTPYSLAGLVSYTEYLFLLTILTSECFRHGCAWRTP